MLSVGQSIYSTRFNNWTFIKRSATLTDSCRFINRLWNRRLASPVTFYQSAAAAAAAVLLCAVSTSTKRDVWAHTTRPHTFISFNRRGRSGGQNQQGRDASFLSQVGHIAAADDTDRLAIKCNTSQLSSSTFSSVMERTSLTRKSQRLGQRDIREDVLRSMTKAIAIESNDTLPSVIKQVVWPRKEPLYTIQLA